MVIHVCPLRGGLDGAEVSRLASTVVDVDQIEDGASRHKKEFVTHWLMTT
jgi:hypothetical protein